MTKISHISWGGYDKGGYDKGFYGNKMCDKLELQLLCIDRVRLQCWVLYYINWFNEAIQLFYWWWPKQLYLDPMWILLYVLCTCPIIEYNFLVIFVNMNPSPKITTFVPNRMRHHWHHSSPAQLGKKENSAFFCLRIMI